MPFSVTNKRNNTTFVVNDKETILEAALRNNRIYPYGCRSGVCGACKCSLVSGTVDYGNYEDFALPDEEKEQGKVLICQAKPLEDVLLDAEEIVADASIQIKVLPCRVRQIDRLAKDVIRLFLVLPKNREFNFIAGQYIDILLKDGQRRSFSLANLPQHAKEHGLELHIRNVVDGHFTPRVFDSMKERDLLRFEGPFGSYVLQSEADTPIIMIAGGTGFSPIKGLIENAMERNPDQNIHLFWGARDEQDLYLDDLVRQWLDSRPSLKYTPVLSESTSASWQGEKGFVHEAVCRAYERFGQFDVYASGPPVMIDCVRNSLQERGMDTKRFYFDSFEFANQR